jgi:hypothetical protein
MVEKYWGEHNIQHSFSERRTTLCNWIFSNNLCSVWTSYNSYWNYAAKIATYPHQFDDENYRLNVY